MFFFKKLALFVLVSMSIASLASGEAITRVKSASTGKKVSTAVPIVRGGKSLGPITPDMVTTLNSAACAAYGLRFFFDFDGLMKSVYGAVPGIVGKTLGKVVGAVLLAHVAFAYQLKHIMKISDTDIAKCNICYSAAYVGYHIWAHVQGVTKSLEGLVVTVILGLLNAYAGYA